MVMCSNDWLMITYFKRKSRRKSRKNVQCLTNFSWPSPKQMFMCTFSQWQQFACPRHPGQKGRLQLLCVPLYMCVVIMCITVYVFCYCVYPCICVLLLCLSLYMCFVIVYPCICVLILCVSLYSVLLSCVFLYTCLCCYCVYPCINVYVVIVFIPVYV